MNNEFDDRIAQLFEKAREPLDSREFVQRVSIQISRARRKRNLAIIALWLTAVVALVAVTPWIVKGSLAFGKSLDLALPYFGIFMLSPAGWILSGMLAVLMLRRVFRPA
jgi:predicted anti-sigma-YlaC factor YlaD